MNAYYLYTFTANVKYNLLYIYKKRFRNNNIFKNAINIAIKYAILMKMCQNKSFLNFFIFYYIYLLYIKRLILK